MRGVGRGVQGKLGSLKCRGDFSAGQKCGIMCKVRNVGDVRRHFGGGQRSANT